MIVNISGKLRINERAREWCKLPYPGHPHGCPSYNRRWDCPPEAPKVENVFDLDKGLWMVVESFDLASHVAKMAQLHPKWSDRQCRNLLYWQGGVKKRLRESVRRLCPWEGSARSFTLCPEAMGVNVIATLKRCEVDIQVHPVDWIYKVALIGYPVNIPTKSSDLAV